MSTMSLRSSIYEFVEENGRTYHSYKQGSKCSFLAYPGHFSQIRTAELTLPPCRIPDAKRQGEQRRVTRSIGPPLS